MAFAISIFIQALHVQGLHILFIEPFHFFSSMCFYSKFLNCHTELSFKLLPFCQFSVSLYLLHGIFLSILHSICICSQLPLGNRGRTSHPQIYEIFTSRWLKIQQKHTFYFRRCGGVKRTHIYREGESKFFRFLHMC